MIQIYGVDPSQNHDAFMCALQDSGIHVIFGGYISDRLLYDWYLLQG